MEAIKYTKDCYDSVAAMIHGMGTETHVIFVPDLKLTFDMNWNVWETKTFEIRASKGMIWDEKTLIEARTNPKLAQQIKKSQDKEQIEIDKIKKTIKHITIPLELAEHIKQLYLICEQKRVIQGKLKELGFPK
jgi:hypothetical protein